VTLSQNSYTMTLSQNNNIRRIGALNLF
jgi:hypothetical protein